MLVKWSQSLVDIALFGTGQFAARILFDIAATAPGPVTIAVIGRDRDRLAWLRTAANARAAMFGRAVLVHEELLPDFSAASDLLRRLAPKVVANTASVQGGRKPGTPENRWTRLAAEAGLGVGAVLHARVSVDLARATAAATTGALFVNCCYPDVVNPMIAAAGLPITCGIGNVAILAHAFAGALAPATPRLQLLAQHAALSAFRRPARDRTGTAPLRAWIDGIEEIGIFDRFRCVKLAPEPVIDVSGASGAPLFAAMVAGTAWSGHVPGPAGRPGGYPVRFDGRVLLLDLPPGLTEDDAVEWNAAFERRNGIIVAPDGTVRYTGRLHDALHAASPELASGFTMHEFDAAFEAMMALRSRLTELA